MVMNKFLFLLLLMIYVDPGSALQSNVILDGDVIVSNALPEWGHTCIATEVRGAPDASARVLYSIGAGARVRIHDQYGAWVSIKAARWVPLKNLCIGE